MLESIAEKDEPGDQRPGDHNDGSRMNCFHADDYDPVLDMSAKANPVTAYQTYLRDVRGGMVGDMGLTVGRFQNLHHPDPGSLIGRKSCNRD